VENRIDAWLILAMTAVLGTSLATLVAVARVVGSQLLVRQLLWGATGLALVWLLSLVHPAVFERLSAPAFALGLAALVAVLVFGQMRAGTRAWFAIGSLTVQPSEFARLATVLMLAAWLARRSRGTLTAVDSLAIGTVVAAPVALVLLEPDLGVAITYVPLLVAALWIGGLPARMWGVLALLAVLAAGLAWHTVLKPYQKERVLTIVDPERDPYGAGYQVRQSKIAVGSGRLIGHGLGSGSQSLLRFLPAQHTDFAFAAWAEATGFVGATALLVAYALLLARVGLVATNAGSKFGLVVAALVGAWLAFQVVVNLGMVLGWLPTTGIPLPLFSYGGSSMLSTCAALGIVQSIWRHRLVNR